MNVEPETLRYFYSAVAQSMAALFTVGGIFAFFNIENINVRLSKTCESFIAYMKLAYPERNSNLNVDKKDTWLSKDTLANLLAVFESNQDDIYLVDCYKEYSNLFHFKKEIKNKLKPLTILTAITFIFSLIALIIVDLKLIVSLNFICFVGLFFLIIATSYLIINYITISVKGSRHDCFNNGLINIKVDKELVEKYTEGIKVEMKNKLTSEREELLKKIIARINKKGYQINPRRPDLPPKGGKSGG